MRTTSKNTALSVRRFTVEVQWVEIEVHIPDRTARFLTGNPRHANQIGEYVNHTANTVNTHARNIDTGEIKHSPAVILQKIRARAPYFAAYLQPCIGIKMQALSMRMPRAMWMNTMQAADALKVEPAVFVRAALLEIERSIKSRESREQTSPRLSTTGRVTA